ncbi:MAG TPA: hypothetical protein VNU19_04995 [Candidatus Acidoferrum sp.]|nr:hypothetical protein [Candidatus Acidoferrum sp.]
MDMRRIGRTVLAVPLLLGGGILVLTSGTPNVFAASPTPQTSSKPHEHEFVVCSPNPVLAGSTCTITFTDSVTKNEPFHPKKVCFSVSPSAAGTVSASSGKCTHEAKSGSNGIATGMFTSSANFCGNPKDNSAVITATEPSEDNQKHHTTVIISCSTIGAANASALIPAGHSSPPAIGWLLGAIGLGAALVAVYALRIRRWFAPRRLAASQSE